MRESLLKVGLDYPEKVCKNIITKYRIMRPVIPQWHLQVEYQLKKTKTMICPAVDGVVKKRVFFGQMWGSHFEDMVKEALAWVPQCTVGQVCALIMRRVRDKYAHQGLDILEESHDSFLFQWPEDWDHIKLFKEIDELGHVPMIINGRELVIPRDFATGPSWGEMQEVKV